MYCHRPPDRRIAGQPIQRTAAVRNSTHARASQVVHGARREIRDSCKIHLDTRCEIRAQPVARRVTCARVIIATRATLRARSASDKWRARARSASAKWRARAPFFYFAPVPFYTRPIAARRYIACIRTRSRCMCASRQCTPKYTSLNFALYLQIMHDATFRSDALRHGRFRTGPCYSTGLVRLRKSRVLLTDAAKGADALCARSLESTPQLSRMHCCNFSNVRPRPLFSQVKRHRALSYRRACAPARSVARVSLDHPQLAAIPIIHMAPLSTCGLRRGTPGKLDDITVCPFSRADTEQARPEMPCCPGIAANACARVVRYVLLLYKSRSVCTALCTLTHVPTRPRCVPTVPAAVVVSRPSQGETARARARLHAQGCFVRTAHCAGASSAG
eukprot:IDg123t1